MNVFPEQEAGRLAKQDSGNRNLSDINVTLKTLKDYGITKGIRAVTHCGALPWPDSSTGRYLLLYGYRKPGGCTPSPVRLVRAWWVFAGWHTRFYRGARQRTYTGAGRAGVVDYPSGRTGK
jgi:hypothetical protein